MILYLPPLSHYWYGALAGDLTRLNFLMTW